MDSPSVSPRPLRICVTGAECTGKTTLAEELGHRLGAPVMHESVRAYFAEKAKAGDASVYAGDIVRIVDMQVRTEERAPHDAPLVILDTDVFTIAIWHERWLGRRYEELDRLAERRQASPDSHVDLYVLAGADIPFVYDGVRGSEEERAEMQPLFRQRLRDTGRDFVEVSGSVAERCEQVLSELHRRHAWASGRQRAHTTSG